MINEICLFHQTVLALNLTMQVNRSDLNSQILPVHLAESRLESALKIAVESITDQIPFSCDETTKQLQQTALEEDEGEKEEATVS